MPNDETTASDMSPGGADVEDFAPSGPAEKYPPIRFNVVVRAPGDPDDPADAEGDEAVFFALDWARHGAGCAAFSIARDGRLVGDIGMDVGIVVVDFLLRLLVHRDPRFRTSRDAFLPPALRLLCRGQATVPNADVGQILANALRSVGCDCRTVEEGDDVERLVTHLGLHTWGMVPPSAASAALIEGSKQ